MSYGQSYSVSVPFVSFSISRALNPWELLEIYSSGHCSNATDNDPVWGSAMFAAVATLACTSTEMDQDDNPLHAKCAGLIVVP